jgi:hypothetical protein
LRWATVALAVVLAGAVAVVAALAIHSHVRDASSAERLAWPPPDLVDPVTITITAAADLQLDPNRDYILQLPTDRPIIARYGCVHIVGGHNIVLLGGVCYVPKQATPSEGSGRALYVEGNTGTIHVEGFYATGPGLTEGIDVFNSPTAVLQVENCRFDVVHNWRNTDIHSDLIQADSLAVLRVDRFTGSSQVQGIFRDGTHPAPTLADLRHVNLVGVSGGSSGRLLWNGSGPRGPYPLRLSDVYISPFPGERARGDVWPGRDQPRRLAPIATSDSSFRWPSATNITGIVHSGRPPSGDFVPSGAVGLNYTSPGYQ